MTPRNQFMNHDQPEEGDDEELIKRLAAMTEEEVIEEVMQCRVTVNQVRKARLQPPKAEKKEEEEEEDIVDFLLAREPDPFGETLREHRLSQAQKRIADD